jgi:hypothetical protein
MSKYTVGITRIGYGHRDLEIEADSQEEAEDKAIDEAGSYEYSENHSKYEIDFSMRVDGQDDD